MDYSKIASIAGKSGLFKVIKATRSGIILESLDDNNTKFVAGTNQRVSVLNDISIYTKEKDSSISLEEVFLRIKKEFGDDLGVTKSSENSELKAFLKHIIFNYDENRVYISDIKKIISWYNDVLKYAPTLLKEKSEEKSCD